jgi:hypothetical protein
MGRGYGGVHFGKEPRNLWKEERKRLCVIERYGKFLG